MPVSAQRAAIGGALAFDPGQKCGVEGVALGAIPPLARTPVLPLFLRGLLHGNVPSLDGLCPAGESLTPGGPVSPRVGRARSARSLP